MLVRRNSPILQSDDGTRIYIIYSVSIHVTKPCCRRRFGGGGGWMLGMPSNLIFLAKLMWVEIRLKSRAEELNMRTMTERKTSRMA